MNGASDSTATATTATANAPSAAGRSAYVGRFAPSPTGPLHLGSLVAALGSFLEARHHGGRWLLRIEDLDRARVQPGCAAEIERTLGELGLHWDGEVQYQSRRLSFFGEAIAELTRQRLTYPCQCTRRMRGEFEDSCYPGTCRNRRVVEGPAAVRFRVDEAGTVSFNDRFQGTCAFALRMLGDVIIRRRDGVIAYQLAVVVDDAAQGITDVVRGADLLQSTAWQLALQRALGLPTPRYAHLPLVVEPDGAKLSKSRRSISLQAKHGSELVEALNLLRQAPPPQLAHETAQRILDWALANWRPTNLERVQKATAPVKLA